jgi:hypothetical protein
VIASGGRLAIEAPGGSLLGSMSAKRVLWHDGPLTLAIDDAVLSLSWRSLLQRRVVACVQLRRPVENRPVEVDEAFARVVVSHARV